MKILDMILAENELASIKEEILEAYKTYKKQNKQLVVELAGNPAVKDISGDLDYVFDEAKKRFAAAQRAVAISNKLNDPEQKKRVWSNLNMLRAFVKNLTKQIESRYEQMIQQAKGSQGAVTSDTRNFTQGDGGNANANQQAQRPGNATGVPPRFGQQQQQAPMGQ